MGNPLMLAGPAGTGKTQLVNGLLQEVDPEMYNTHTIAMNFYSDGTALQNVLELPLQKQTGKSVLRSAT